MDLNMDLSGSSIGKYYLIKRIGRGNYGVVYRVKDRVLRTEKAIKIMTISNPQEAKKAFNEAAIPYKCKHNNIVCINSADLIEHNNEILFIIDMEYASDGSLEDLLKKKFIPVNRGLEIITDVLFGLEHAHLQGIIHRDVKPANILFNNKKPLISDFGLSTIINTVNPGDWYMWHAAPECLMEESVATVETDIFALGLTMFRLINSISEWDNLVYAIPNIRTVLLKGKLIESLEFKPYVPNKVKKIIRKACNPHPTRRYRSAFQMRNEIQKLKFNFDWTQLSEYNWIGRNSRGEQRELFLKSNKNKVEFIVKKNKRKFSDHCRTFDNLRDATDYMYDYICKTTLI